MKALVALTCIAVLAAVGYFFWNELDLSDRINPPNPGAQAAKQRIFHEPGVMDGNEAGARRYCEYRRDASGSLDRYRSIIEDCRTAGFIK